MRLILTAIALTVAATSVRAEQIRCAADGQSPVVVSLKSQRYAGRDMSCISGSFVADLTPCAPSKAFSLSAPTGSASIVGVVDRWQDYAHHRGGVVGYFKSHTTIAFTGGFNSPREGLKDDWSFTVDRQTRKGTLIRLGKPAAVYACSGAI
jgi:hypothetical protein